MKLNFPAEGVLIQHLAHLAYKPEKARIAMPEKKQKNQKFSKKVKAYNKLISNLVVTVEHVVAEIKGRKEIKDKIIMIDRGLHNFRIACRNLSQ